MYAVTVMHHTLNRKSLMFEFMSVALQRDILMNCCYYKVSS